MHLLGRSRFAASPNWTWGEAPRFPVYADRYEWAAGNRRLTPQECVDIVAQAKRLLEGKYGMAAPEVRTCPVCFYPSVKGHACAEGV
jgi:hypothetical protein